MGSSVLDYYMDTGVRPDLFMGVGEGEGEGDGSLCQLNPTAYLTLVWV